jgi:hypothetical protein
MNAGGVPNTCKLSGKASTGYLIEPGRGISFKKFRITKEGGTMAIVLISK